MYLVLIALTFAFGITGSLLFEGSGEWLVFGLGGLVVPFALFRFWRIAVLIGIVTFGTYWGDRAWKSALAPSPVEENAPLPIEGVVAMGPIAAASPPRSGSGGLDTNGSRMVVLVHKIAGSPIHGTLDVHVPGKLVVPVVPGDHVLFKARVFRPYGFHNPGLPDPRLAVAAKGTDWTGVVEGSPGVIRVVGVSWLFPLRRGMHSVRVALVSAIDRSMEPRYANFVRIMVLGERSITDPGLEEGFRAAGATHALSVSGLHLAVVSTLIFFFFTRAFSRMPGMGLWISARSLAAIFSLPFIWCYTVLTGEAVATLRSAWMATVVLGGIALGRSPSLATSMAWAALVLLLGSPLLLVDVSFQLSFLSVIALGVFTGQKRAEVANSSWRWLHRGGRWVLASIRVSSTACLLTAPLVAHHFGEVTPTAPIGNLVLVPLVELLVLPCGLLGSMVGAVHPMLGFLPLWVAALGARATLFLSDLFRWWAPIWATSRPTYFETGAFLTGISLCLWGIRQRLGWRNKLVVAGAASLVVAVFALTARIAERWLRNDVRCTFLDVGQGDSILIEGPRGFVALIDGGGRYDDAFDTGARIVGPVLAAKGIRRVNLMVLSHPHPDHLNGLFSILRQFRVDRLWTNGDSGGNPSWNDLIALARDRKVEIESPYRFETAGLVLEPRGPWLDNRIRAPKELDVNDASLVLQSSFMGRKILLTGDIGEQGELELLGRAGESIGLASDLLKVPHHGSRYSSGTDFIAGVQPQMGVISVGRFNRFGLPNPVTLERYNLAGIRLLRTDRSGAISVLIEESGKMSATCVLPCR